MEGSHGNQDGVRSQSVAYSHGDLDKVAPRNVDSQECTVGGLGTAGAVRMEDAAGEEDAAACAGLDDGVTCCPSNVVGANYDLWHAVLLESGGGGNLVVAVAGNPDGTEGADLEDTCGPSTVHAERKGAVLVVAARQVAAQTQW